jgi:TRAP-type transport system periplasmic protein
MKITDMNPGEREKIVQMMQPLYKQVATNIGGDLVDRLLSATK